MAEERFLSNSHNWTFDNTWQEMLNHATNKVNTNKFFSFYADGCGVNQFCDHQFLFVRFQVMEAEKQKAECHAEHQRKAHIFSRAEMEVSVIDVLS